MRDGTGAAIAAGQRLERDLSTLAHLVEAALQQGLDVLNGVAATQSVGRARRRLRIGVLQEEIERRSLRMMADGHSTPALRRVAAAGFNRAVLLGALADRAEALAERGARGAAVAAMAEAALACVRDLARPTRARTRVATLNTAIAEARRSAVDAASPALVLEQVGELVCELRRAAPDWSAHLGGAA